MSTAVKAGRPRNADLDRALLEAAQDLLIEVGYDRLSIDAVAARCGAGKSTVYRRWAGKPELVADAVALLPGVRNHADTGSLRGDLMVMASAWVDPDVRRDAVVGGLLTAMARDAGLREAVRCAVAAPYEKCFETIIERAIDRGEVPAGLDLKMLATVFPAITRYHLSVLATPISRDMLERIIDGVLLPALMPSQKVVAA